LGCECRIRHFSTFRLTVTGLEYARARADREKLGIKRDFKSAIREGIEPRPRRERSMTKHSERFTDPALEGVYLHAVHWGDPDQPVLILLHGGGANTHWWDHVAPRLALRWHVVALDFRGHGDSDHPDELIPGAFGEDLEALIGHLGSPPVALLGHSMGGGVALAHGAAHASDASVRAIVAVDVSRGAARRSRRGARLALALRRTYDTHEEAVARYRFLPASDHASETLRAAIAEASVREEPDGRFGFKFDPRWFTIGSRDRPPLERIQCPTLIVRGSESALLTPGGVEALISELQDGHAETIERAGHHVHLDQPEAFLVAVEGFLDRQLAGEA
jgi:pimeloyl-ACP methyl ester carboxylesterase